MLLPGKQHYVDLTGFEKILQEAGSGACPQPRLCAGISGPLQLTRGHQDTKEEVCVTAPDSKRDLLQQDSKTQQANRRVNFTRL